MLHREGTDAPVEREGPNSAEAPGQERSPPWGGGSDGGRQTWWYMTDVKALNANFTYSRATLSIRGTSFPGWEAADYSGSTGSDGGQILTVYKGTFEKTMILGSVISSIAYRSPSRPYPDSLEPPYGIWSARNADMSFTITPPTSSSRWASMARSMDDVNTPA
jgi:hypothetical protein